MSRMYDDFTKVSCSTTIKEERDGYYSFMDNPFWSEKGGMPSDNGKVNGLDIIDSKWEADEVFIKVDGKLSNPIQIEVDYKTRWKNTALQTAFHALDSYYENRGMEIISIGCNHGNEWYEVNSKELDEKHLQEVEDYMIQVINGNHPVSFSYIKGSEYPNPAYQMHEEVRIVDVEDVNNQPCGTLHVNNTLEIGNFVVLDYERTSRGTKIYISCNLDTNDTLHEYYNIVKKLSRLTKTNLHDLEAYVNNLLNSNRDLKKELAELKRELAIYQVENIKNNQDVLVELSLGMDQRLIAQELSRVISDTKVLYQVDGELINFTIVSGMDKAREIFDEIKSKVEATGGGSLKIVSGKSSISKEKFVEIANSSNVSC